MPRHQHASINTQAPRHWNYISCQYPSTLLICGILEDLAQWRLPLVSAGGGPLGASMPLQNKCVHRACLPAWSGQLYGVTPAIMALWARALLLVGSVRPNGYAPVFAPF